MSTTIESLELEIRSNSQSAISGIDALTQSLLTLRNATKGGLGLSAIAKETGKLSQAMSSLSLTAGKSSASFTDLYHKMSLGSKVITTLSKNIWSAIGKSNDYIENLNLFRVSMGSASSTALTYAESISEVLGIDTSDWIRNQGVFMTMATGFGVASDRAETMSQNLTQLGYDLSSFYNISVKDAMTKLKSGLAGELEPLRAIGYDLSQAKLEAIALERGITKSVSAMTQAEKAQLRYYAIMTQVTDAHNDLARTLNDPANQLRVLEAEFNMAAREIGNVFVPALTSILPYVIAVVKVIRLLASNIASLFGHIPDEIGEGTTKIVENTDAMTQNIEESQDAAKKLKSYMLGFDELNVINPNAGSEDDSGWVDFPLPTYDMLEGLTESRVGEIVEDMKKWLGLTKEINSWADLFNTKLGKILIVVGSIGAGILLWSIGGGVISAVLSVITTIESLGAAITTIQTALLGVGSSFSLTFAVIAIGAIAAVVAGLVAVYESNENVRIGVNNAIESIRTSLVPLFTFIVDTVLPGLKSAWEELLNVLTPFGEWLKTVFTSIWEDILIPVLEWVGDTLLPSLTSVLKHLWNDVLVPLGTFLSSVFTPIIRILFEVFTMLWQEVIVPLAEAIGNVLGNAWVALTDVLTVTVMPIIFEVITILQNIWHNALEPLVEFLWDILAPTFEGVFNDIGDIIRDVEKLFSGLIDFIAGVFTGDWKRAWDGIVNALYGSWGAVGNLFKVGLNALISLVEGVINKIIDGWNLLKKAINSLSIELPDWLGGGTFGLNLKMTEHISLGRFAEGGFPETGQLFIAREAGAEMVGNIGRRTAVANNDQIVSSVAGGVAQANEEQNALLREQNSLLRALLEKDSGVYIDGKHLTDSVEKYQRERGRGIIVGGVI